MVQVLLPNFAHDILEYYNVLQYCYNVGSITGNNNHTLDYLQILHEINKKLKRISEIEVINTLSLQPKNSDENP